MDTSWYATAHEESSQFVSSSWFLIIEVEVVAVATNAFLFNVICASVVAL